MYRRANRFSQPNAFTRSPWGWGGTAETTTDGENPVHVHRRLYAGAQRDDCCAHVIVWIEHKQDELPF